MPVPLIPDRLRALPSLCVHIFPALLDCSAGEASLQGAAVGVPPPLVFPDQAEGVPHLTSCLGACSGKIPEAWLCISLVSWSCEEGFRIPPSFWCWHV